MFTFTKNENGVEAFANETFAGEFKISHEGMDYYRVENVNIEAAFRGCGLYKQMINAAFDLFNCDNIRSEKRNDLSNPIYENWVGENLEYETAVWITRENGKLVFTA